MVYLYRCPICGSILYNSSLFVQNPNPIYLSTSSYIPESKILIQQDEQNLIPPSELIQLKGKQIQTTIPLLGTITACVGDYDATTNRVKLSNITKVSNGEKIGGTMGYLPEELVGYEIINETCPSPIPGPTPGPTGKVETTVIEKTIASAHLPRGWSMRLYRAYLKVTVPVAIEKQAQDILDSCMKLATDRAKAYMVPYAIAAGAALNPSPIVSALPGAVAEALKTFTVCVGSNPIIYPYIANNTIKISADHGWD